MDAGNALRRELPAVARFVHRLRGRRCAGAVFDAGEGARQPPVDFSRDMVVALFMGERPTGGFAIEVTRIERTDSGLSVHYRTTRPDPAAMQPQALTQPFHLIALPRSDDPVTFVAESPSR
jgi:protease stability complex PrcB-like protein